MMIGAELVTVMVLRSKMLSSPHVGCSGCLAGAGLREQGFPAEIRRPAMYMVEPFNSDGRLARHTVLDSCRRPEQSGTACKSRVLCIQIELLHARLHSATLRPAVQYVGGAVVAAEKGRHRMVENANATDVSYRIANHRYWIGVITATDIGVIR